MNEWISRARAACVAVAIGAAAGAAPALADRDGDPPHQRFELGDFQLENRQVIESGFLTYVTHGTLNEQESNAVLVLPALMATHHRHDFLIGPGKALDPEKFFIIAADTLGNGRAISPSNSETQPGISFPQFSIRDMVAAQHRLVTEGLGLERLLAVVGLSMGGMQAYQWAVSHPDTMAAIVPIVSMGRTSPWVTAIWESQRQAIMADPDWCGGDYLNQGVRPHRGLAVARMAAHITYLSEAALHRKFGRNLQNRTTVTYGFDADFQVESYLRHQGSTFVRRFDANSYLTITRAMDYFDLAAAHGGVLANAFRVKDGPTPVRFCLTSFSSDWLFPTTESRAVVHALNAVAANVSFVEVATDKGHDAFLLDEPEFRHTLRGFLRGAAEQLGV